MAHRLSQAEMARRNSVRATDARPIYVGGELPVRVSGWSLGAAVAYNAATFHHVGYVPWPEVERAVAHPDRTLDKRHVYPTITEALQQRRFDATA